MPNSKTIAIDTHALPWEERFNEKIGRALYHKNLLEDPETGMEVRLVRYPAGVINPHRKPRLLSAMGVAAQQSPAQSHRRYHQILGIPSLFRLLFASSAAI